jgi:hypothetical protein
MGSQFDHGQHGVLARKNTGFNTFGQGAYDSTRIVF